MPWHIVGDSSECPASKPFSVIKDSDGSSAGCHETREKAEAQLAALYANEPKTAGGVRRDRRAKMTSNFHHLDVTVRRAIEMENAGVVFEVDELAPLRAAADGGAGWAAALLAVGDFNPDLHPRGMDGKFIDVFGFVNLVDMPGFRHGQRGDKKVQGQVVAIIPNPGDPGNPTIRVKMTDPRWDVAQFGETFDAHRGQISARTSTKGKLPDPNTKPVPIDTATPSDIPAVATHKPPIGGELPPPMAPRPGMTEHPSSPQFPPLELPPNWPTMDNTARHAWVSEQMQTRLSEWTGKDFEFNLNRFPDKQGEPRMEAGLAVNLANTYLQLANWDPETARRLDYVRDDVMLPNVAAVANPGTDHPGGIGPVTKPIGIEFHGSLFTQQKFLDSQALSAKHKIPWSVDAANGDGSFVMIHEFAHQRQFRFLHTAMNNANRLWSPVTQEDGFGEVPDSSKWPETQALREHIHILAPTKYGTSRSSEAYAEAWAARHAGMSSPELDSTLDRWEENMGVPTQVPPPLKGVTGDQFDAKAGLIKPFKKLTPEEQATYWIAVEPILDIPGMREHYPETAAAFDEWAAHYDDDVEPTMMPGVADVTGDTMTGELTVVPV